MCWLWHARRLRKRLHHRKPLSDDEFVDQIGVSVEDREWAAAIRRAFAMCCRVPYESIDGTDVFEDLAEALMVVGWDELDFIFALECETHVKNQRGKIQFPVLARWSGWVFPKRLGPGMQVGAWVANVVPQLRAVMRDEQGVDPPT